MIKKICLLLLILIPLFNVEADNKSRIYPKKQINYFPTNMAIGEMLVRTQSPDISLDTIFKDRNKTVSSTQTYMRVTFSNVYERPFFLAVFADHYREPWYSYHSISKQGLENGLNPTQTTSYFSNGEQTQWINLTSMIYSDTGARLVIRTAYTYWVTTQTLKAKFEFASAPDEQSIVKTIERESTPAYMHIIMPPNLSSADNIAKLKTDYEFAIPTGMIADSKNWPTFGKKPNSFPFFITTNIEPEKMDQVVAHRELKTLSYYGYNGPYRTDKPFFNLYGFNKTRIHPITVWTLRNNQSYLEPKINEMKTEAKADFDRFIKNGGVVSDIDYCMLWDEPLGADVAKLAADPVAKIKFREWLQSQSKTLNELFPTGNGSETWDMVKPVTSDEKNIYPALYYYTHKFRTYSLGSYIQLQKEIIHQAYGSNFPVNVNFSDGVVYKANYYYQGVDYFELMETTSQNSIWGEDWASFSSTYQCAAFNTDLLRAAARRSNAHIGSYIIAYQGRKPWDIKLKAMSAVARGVKSFNNFYYGPFWGGHEGGWDLRPENWIANAEIVREIGGAEEMLYPAKTKKAEVAILYSSSSDIWSLDRNHSIGFDRMHTWLALSHAQIPVDILSERDIEDDVLNTYKVCYFSGINITQKAAIKLQEWVKNGGILIVTAGAGMKDEYNQTLSSFENMLPVNRNTLEELQNYVLTGRNLDFLLRKDYVTSGSATSEVLSVRQRMTAKPGAVVLGRFSNSSSAIVKGSYEKGLVYCYGFLPALSYIKEAITYRKSIENNVLNPSIPDANKYVSEEQLVGRSFNPWKFPAGIREMIIQPVKDALIELPLKCSEPLIDAVIMESPNGIVIPLSNYTLQPLNNITLTVKSPITISRIESVHHGNLDFTSVGTDITFSLPIQETDIVMLYFDGTSVSYNYKNDENIILSPNPTTNNFKLNANGKLSVYASNGIKVKEIMNYKKNDDVSLINSPNGIYIIKMTNDDGSYSSKLIKK